MPDTPGTINFPAALDTAVSLIEAPLLPAQTTLAAGVAPAALSIPLTNAANFSASGVAMLLDSLTAPTVIEKVVYTSISGGALVVPTGGRGKFGTTAQSWTAGAIVAQLIGGEAHNVLAEAIIQLQTKVGAGAESVADLTRLGKTAGEALGGHRAVRLVGGQAFYADQSEAAKHGVVGITAGAASSGAPVTIITSGEIEEGSWAWTPQQPIFLSTNGLLTQTPPISGALIEVGLATAATRLFVRVQSKINLI